MTDIFFTVSLPDLAATEALAVRIAPLVRAGDCIALYGDLGAGKTAFTRGLLHALGIAGEIPSPTFTLVQSYQAGDLSIAHFDLYRLKNAAELDELGWSDALADGLVVVEWPDRAGTFLPSRRFDLTLTVNADGPRSAKCSAVGQWDDRWAALMAAAS